MGPQAIGVLMEGLVAIAAIGGLVYYCINRKWNKDELADTKVGPLRLLIRYRVELILFVVLFPSAWELISSWFN